MKCPKCNTSNPGDSAFCTSCGAKLNKEEKFEVPAVQAQKIVKRFKGLLKQLSLAEKIIAVGALVGLVSFFLPWISNPKDVAKGMELPEIMTGRYLGFWAYLVPLLMLVSLALLYFSVGASSKTKIKFTFYQVLIGSVFATAGIVLNSVISQVKNWYSKQLGASAGIYAEEISKELEKVFQIEIGVWLLILGCMAMVIGAFLALKENLKD